MKHRLLGAVAAAVLAAVPLVVSPGQADAAVTSTWPQPGYDVNRSYYNPNESVVNARSIKSLKQRWQISPTPSDCPGLPAQIGPVVASGLTLTQDNTGLLARDSATGRQVWKTDIGIDDRTAHNLVVAGTTVIVTASSKPCYVEGGESDGHIVAFNLATGAHLWSASDDTDANHVIVTDGMVIVSGENYATEPLVTAYRLSDGAQVWSDGTNSDGARTFASMIPINHHVLVNHYGYETVLRNTVTGDQTGSWPAAWQPLTATPTGDRVFVGDSNDWTLKALRASDLRVLWSMDRVSNRVATDGKRLYMGIGTKLEAYDTATGKLHWTVDLGGRVGQPVRAGGLIYAPINGKPLAVRNASTGAKTAPSAALSAAKTVEAIGGGHLYATTGPNRIGVFAP